MRRAKTALTFFGSFFHSQIVKGSVSLSQFHSAKGHTVVLSLLKTPLHDGEERPELSGAEVRACGSFEILFLII